MGRLPLGETHGSPDLHDSDCVIDPWRRASGHIDRVPRAALARRAKAPERCGALRRQHGQHSPVPPLDVPTGAPGEHDGWCPRRCGQKRAVVVRPDGIGGRGERAADLALFGRMIADRPDFNVEAASQVAHAISTNHVTTEFDFYTAVDDLKPQDTAGADMLGTVEFNSACFYRYANIDIAALLRNLKGDTELARQTVAAFIRATVDAIPTGKQNSMAAHNPPTLVMAVVREHGAWNLANAFLKPARPEGQLDLMQTSIDQLDTCWAKLASMYGSRDMRGVWIATQEPQRLAALKTYLVAANGGSQVDALIHQAVTAAFAPATA